jgi:hypothetical protein
MNARNGLLILASVGCVATGATAASAQTRTLDFLRGDAASAGPVVRDAPYAGDGVTTVKATLFDGTRIERTVTAKFYRDSAGRVRREQTVMGLAELDPARDTAQIVTIVDPAAGVVWTLNTESRTAHRLLFRTRSMAAPPPPPPPPPAGVGMAGPGAPPPPPAAPPKPVEEAIGTREIEGLRATGVKSTLTIPAGQIGNDRPIVVTEERWQSPELGVLLYSRRRDPRTSDVEYRLTNITRTEPSADLFTVPSDYTVVEPPPPPPPPPGQ